MWSSVATLSYSRFWRASVWAALGLGMWIGPIPWDIGAAVDNGIYMVEMSLASLVWMGHPLLLGAAYVINRVSQLLTRDLLPLAVNIVINYLRSAGLFQTIVELAIVFAALSLVLSFVDVRIADLRKIFIYGFLAALVIAAGPQTMSSVDNVRRSIASAIYSRAYDETGGVWGGVFGGVSGAPPDWAAFGGVRDYDGDGISVADIAMSALDVGDGEQFSSVLPSGFANRFFPYPSITSFQANARASAIETGWHGVLRLAMAYPLSVVAVGEAILQIMFAVASFVLLTAMPIALLFAFFLPTESIILTLLKQYMNLVVAYLVVSVLMGISVAALQSAAGYGNLTLANITSLLNAFFFYFGFGIAKQVMVGSFTTLTGAIAQTTGVREPVGELLGLGQRAAGTAVGLAGAGLAVAAGAPMLAGAAYGAGQSLAGGEEGEQRGGLLLTGMAFLGGKMMQGTPLAGAATSISMLESFGGKDGILGLAGQLTPADATLAGLTSSSNPLTMLMAMDRSVLRRERLARRYGGQGGQDGPDDGGQTAPPPPSPLERDITGNASSPWRREIDAALERYGPEWVSAVAQAITRTMESLGQTGLDSMQIAGSFCGKDKTPTLKSASGRLLFDELPLEVRQTLVDPEAQAAVGGMIGQAAMPRAVIPQNELMQAMREAVQAGATDGAKSVADRLGTSTTALGSAYGVINACVNHPGEFTPDQVRAMLPPSLTVVRTSMPAQAASITPIMKGDDQPLTGWFRVQPAG